MSRAFACSDAARDRGDDPSGTAVPRSKWLLVEHPGPWAFDAFAGSGIGFAVRAELTAAVRAADARLVLVRRPGRPAPSARRAWAVIDNRPGVAAVWGSWADDADLLAATVALARPEPAAGAAQPALLLVCTHGRHDTCCAVRGRPVAAALQHRWPAETWECSHVGGDRFAANVIVLPSDTYYGNLDEQSAVSVVAEHLAGRVDAEHLRGMGTEPRVAQAAIARAHRDFGPAGARAFRSVTVDPLDATTWRVRLRGSGGVPPALVAVVAQHRQAPALLTCRAGSETSAVTYTVASLTASGGAGDG